MIERIIAGAAGAVVAAVILSVVTVFTGWVSDLFEPLEPSIPDGAILALLKPCADADGWEEYAEGAGKFLLGTGTGTLRPQGPHAPTLERGQGEIPLSEIKFGDQGGSEMHALSIEEIPSHRHPVGELEWGFDVDGNDHPARIEVDDGQPWNGNTGRLVAKPVGGGQPHNNMPPYIAVYFCKKS